MPARTRKKPLWRAFTGAELAIDRIDVACEQRGGIGIGARDEHGRRPGL